MQGFKTEEENGKLKSDRLCGIWVCLSTDTDCGLGASPLQVREYRHGFRKLKMGDKIAHITLCNPARALRALGLLLADGAPTVGGGKTF